MFYINVNKRIVHVHHTVTWSKLERKRTTSLGKGAKSEMNPTKHGYVFDVSIGCLLSLLVILQQKKSKTGF